MPDPLPSRCDINAMMMPTSFEVLWVLALETDKKPDALARDVYEHAFKRGRPSYQQWTPNKVGSHLATLRRRGLVANSAETDNELPGSLIRRWSLTEKGWAVLNP